MTPRISDLTVQSAIETMLSGGQKNRIEGVANLKLVFEHNAKSASLDTLKDRAYHSIFEALFKVAHAEKQAYLVAKTQSSRTKAEGALGTCSDVLRMTIRAGAEKIKKRTVRAVIEHVTQLLPVANGEYCAGLSQFYLKVLGALLEHEAHVEHLEVDEWLMTVDFCLQGINNYDNGGLGDDLRSSRASASLSTPFSTSGRTSATKSSLRTTSDMNSANSVTKKNSEELLECLLYLISATNSPIIERAEQILHAIIHFLRSHGFLVSPIHQVAFSALNCTLSAVSVDRAFLVQSLAPEIVPLMTRLWSSKSLTREDEMLNSVRDEMLITFLLLHLHIERIVTTMDSSNADLQNNIEEFETVLRSDYAKRVDRDQLQLDDLDLGKFGGGIAGSRNQLQIGDLRIRSHAVRAERKWAILKSLCLLDRLLHIQPRDTPQVGQDEAMDESRHPRKRRRIAHQLDGLTALVSSQDIGERLSSLQILLFVLPDLKLSKQSLDEFLPLISPCVGDKQGLGSWAMLVIACCSQQAASRSCSFEWTSLWHTVVRLLTSATTCRAACFLLHVLLANNLVSYKAVAEDIDMMVTTSEINTPSILCDSSLSLMTHLLHLRNMEVPGGSSAACSNVVRWLSARWNPVEKFFVTRCGLDVHPIDILNLIRTSLGLPIMHLSDSRHTTSGIIGQAWMQQCSREEMLRYLLLLNPLPKNSSDCTNCISIKTLHQGDHPPESSSQGFTGKRLIIDLFHPRFESLLQDWEAYTKDESTHLSMDTLRCNVSVIILGCLLTSLVADSYLRKASEQFEAVLKRLCSLLLMQLRKAEDAQVLSEPVLQAIQPYLPAVRLSELRYFCQHYLILMQFICSLRDTIAFHHSSTKKSVANLIAEDLMDLDDIFDSQDSRPSRESSKSNFSRRNLTLEMSPAAFYSMTFAHMVLVTSMKEIPEATCDLPSSFVDYIVTLRTQDTLMCRLLLRDIVQSDLPISLSDTSRLVEHIANIPGPATYDCCEVALTLCLDVLKGSVIAWTSPESIGDLSERALQLYEWFLTVVLPLGRPSPSVQTGLVDLLIELIRIRPDFGETSGLPSARSCLFDILLNCSLPAKFHIAHKLPDLFSGFVLKLHSSILSDVIETLPLNADWAEGIAFRLYVLSALASRWPTLIRQCTYYMLEVPGNIPSSVDHATRCMTELSNVLGLESARALFQLFASQLLYTWLAVEPMDHIPFQIFGYDTLHDIVLDNKEEIVALMIMRGQDDHVNDVSNLLETTIESLLQQCFIKVIAYSIAHDISVPRVDNAKKYVTGEARIRKRLGKELFFGLVNRHFADIVALFYHLIDQEDQVEKSFTKNPNLLYAADIINDIKSLGASDVVLPPNQQPAFKARYLTSQIEHLCGRTEYEVRTIYSPPLITFVARYLLNTIHSSLGSLHACAVLRKLRMLIALSGPAALDGYPHEMLLNSLRAFITDPECADDAIGIAQYLLARGHIYLSTTPSFMIGISLSLIASLRGFLDSSPASTTQQSQYRLTLSKAQSFHKWFGSYLSSYETQVLTGPSRAAFQLLLQSAHAFRSGGIAEIGTPESTLLRELLEDKRSGRQLLNNSSRNLAVSRLFGNFIQPKSFRTDMFGADHDAAAFAPTLWSLCRDAEVHGSFLIWAGKVLGRAFAATGEVHHQLKRESELLHPANTGTGHQSDETSECYILKLLQTLTLDESGHTAGIAEAALRVIISVPDMTTGVPDRTNYIRSMSESLYQACAWAPYHIPAADILLLQSEDVGDPYCPDALLDPLWPRNVAMSLVRSVPSDTILYALQGTLMNAKGFAEEAFPFIVHLALCMQVDGAQYVRRQLSAALRSWLSNVNDSAKRHLKLLINSLLYLRTQPLPREKSSADRTRWLDFNYLEVAEAAVRCGMYKTALLFVEISISEVAKTSRRSSINKSTKATEPTELLLSIFKNIDDPDVFYGLQQKPNLSTILSRLEYERDGQKSLAFRGAQYDTHLRRQDSTSTIDGQALVNALGVLNLDGVSHSLLQSQQSISMDSSLVSSMFNTARKLEQWDLPVPANLADEAATVYKTFQAVVTAMDHETVTCAVNDGLNTIMSRIILEGTEASTIHSSLQSLAVLTEMDEVLGATGSEEFEDILKRFQARKSWMNTGKFDDVSHILSCRETTLSSLSQHIHLRDMVGISASESRLIEVQTTLLSSQLNRAHGALQEGLKSATYLTHLIEPCKVLGLTIAAAAQLEAANALWEQGEMASSIGMLQDLETNPGLGKQTVPIGKPDLLAKIGYQVSVARLEKPDRIIEKYLNPALKELKGKAKGGEAGQVFHEFAVFCDQQLSDADTIEDLNRLRTLKEMKESEVRDLNKMYKSATSSEQKHKYHAHLVKARQWLQLDNEEFNRLSQSNTELLRQSLENYLLSLTASDDHTTDALRFTALWLQNSEFDIANESVGKHLANVPTRMFASLMNQLTSRLLDNTAKFQQLLFSLVLSISTDHPYHGMYQIWSGSRTRGNTKDETAMSRQAATNKVGNKLSINPKSAKIWSAINSTSKVYCQFAVEKDDARYKAGQKIQLKDSQAGTTLSHMLPRFPIPPPTMQVDIAIDLDYSSVPTMIKLEPQISIATGVSAPKIITVVASNGGKYKQLVKGGNDDLRQDAIMEQVFAQVSRLLAANTSTRQRNLGIRTYKVLPLTSNAGIIEFVPHTIPLHEYLMPAHERYYPKDLKGTQCRKEIGDVQTQRLEVRIKKYRAVTDQFHPVMRYFFLEKFYDPDEWFARRLAYTRSTAAISMLGYILGLGDRHGHNILLDEKTGEAIHIDLGVAFEMGRVLPVPELVPFRLTRDIVDGMGITKTEGVYRRCCEFTLEALRKEAYSIMTILDVLRYDPLYSWSISPVRLAKLQDAQSVAPALSTAGEATTGNTKTREAVNEPSEADRALTVVKKKLSKTLSVTATVNDLINQATDERNLAALYSGWAAYA